MKSLTKYQYKDIFPLRCSSSVTVVSLSHRSLLWLWGVWLNFKKNPFPAPFFFFFT